MSVEILAAALVAATLVGVPLTYAARISERCRAESRETAQTRAVAQQTYITELQNRLASHTWGEFAQLQNEVASHTGQTVAALNSFGEARSEEAYGERAEDLVDALLRDAGIDMEGPTVG